MGCFGMCSIALSCSEGPFLEVRKLQMNGGLASGALSLDSRLHTSGAGRLLTLSGPRFPPGSTGAGTDLSHGVGAILSCHVCRRGVECG